MNIIYTDSLVIGGGLAGLRVAIAAKQRGYDSIILSLVPAKRSHSAAAQGGMQASLGACAKGEGDKELASRDVVSRRMIEHIRKGKGVQSPYGDHLWLDISLLGSKHIEKNLREIKEICEYFLGIDPVSEYIPVRPTQHYAMGGVRTKATGESPTLKGLFSAGEAACWDLHGFNRLGGNSVAETVVAGMIVGEFVADYCAASSLTISTATIEHFI